MKEVTIQLTSEECEELALLMKEYKETNGVCDASRARLLANISKL